MLHLDLETALHPGSSRKSTRSAGNGDGIVRTPNYTRYSEADTQSIIINKLHPGSCRQANSLHGTRGDSHLHIAYRQGVLEPACHKEALETKKSRRAGSCLEGRGQQTGNMLWLLWSSAVANIRIHKPFVA